MPSKQVIEYLTEINVANNGGDDDDDNDD